MCKKKIARKRMVTGRKKQVAVSNWKLKVNGTVCKK
jgi:hypothetical protein